MGTLLELIKVLGPKLKEALPLILDLIRLFAAEPPDSFNTIDAGKAFSSGDDAQLAINEAVANGCDENEIRSLVNLVDQL